MDMLTRRADGRPMLFTDEVALQRGDTLEIRMHSYGTSTTISMRDNYKKKIVWDDDVLDRFLSVRWGVTDYFELDFSNPFTAIY